MSGTAKTQAVSFSGNACTIEYYDVLIRFKIEEHRGVYQWREFDRDSYTIAQLKTQVQAMIDSLKTDVENNMDVTLS